MHTQQIEPGSESRRRLPDHERPSGRLWCSVAKLRDLYRSHRASLWAEMRECSGSTLLISMLILGALGILATSISLTTMADRNLSKNEKYSVHAFAAAETGVAFAKNAIVNRTAPITDEDSDGRPDFRLQDSLSWGSSYSIFAETQDPIGNAYHARIFTIISEGRYRGSTRRVMVEIEHDTFLKFARFIEEQAIQYQCGDIVAGEVYAGANVSLACGCPPGKEPKFLEQVRARGHVPQANCGQFQDGYEEDTRHIQLEQSFDWDEIRSKARGFAANSSCEGKGAIGLYIALDGIDPLGLAAQAGDDAGVVILDRFDFVNTELAPGDTVITYNGEEVYNTITGQGLRRSDFNGIIFFEGIGRVKGTLDGVSAYSLSVFATNELIIMGDIIRGHEGFDPVTRLPDGSGNPVTCAVVAENEVTFWQYTPKVLRMDTAIFSRNGKWRGTGGVGEHPDAGPGPLDLDIDGISGESPVNNDPDPGLGWDEMEIDSHTWVLNFDGPIITKLQGDAYPWNSNHVIAQAQGPTYRHNYSLDYEEFPPSCFPLPANVWMEKTWTEIFEVRSSLASHMPH